MNYLVLECFDSLTFGIREGMFTILTWLITIFSWGAELEIGTEMLSICYSYKYRSTPLSFFPALPISFSFYLNLSKNHWEVEGNVCHFA